MYFLCVGMLSLLPCGGVSASLGAPGALLLCYTGGAVQVGGLGWVGCAHRAGADGRVILNGVKIKIMYEKCVSCWYAVLDAAFTPDFT